MVAAETNWKRKVVVAVAVVVEVEVVNPSLSPLKIYQNQRAKMITQVGVIRENEKGTKNTKNKYRELFYKI